MNTEIILTYCPSTLEKNRICGHTFEVMDYFLLFYDMEYSGIKILIQENIDKEIMYNAWEDKYNLPKDYKKYIIFSQKKIILSKNILIFTGGLYDNYLQNYKLIYKKLILMRCEPTFNYNKLSLKKYIVLEDNRVYSKYNLSINGIHYIKKIYFKRYKKINSTSAKILIYINSNLRKIPKNILKEKEKYLIITGDSQPDKSYLKAPIKNLFEKFGIFLYTETTRRFDCSPRLIAECKFYNKKIIFNFNIIDYFKTDSGLKYRWYDIQNNFNNLILNKDDTLIKVIHEKLN